MSTFSSNKYVLDFVPLDGCDRYRENSRLASPGKYILINAIYKFLFKLKLYFLAFTSNFLTWAGNLILVSWSQYSQWVLLNLISWFWKSAISLFSHWVNNKFPCFWLADRFLKTTLIKGLWIKDLINL